MFDINFISEKSCERLQTIIIIEKIWKKYENNRKAREVARACPPREARFKIEWIPEYWGRVCSPARLKLAVSPSWSPFSYCYSYCNNDPCHWSGMCPKVIYSVFLVLIFLQFFQNFYRFLNIFFIIFFTISANFFSIKKNIYYFDVFFKTRILLHLAITSCLYITNKKYPWCIPIWNFQIHLLIFTVFIVFFQIFSQFCYFG